MPSILINIFLNSRIIIVGVTIECGLSTISCVLEIAPPGCMPIWTLSVVIAAPSESACATGRPARAQSRSPGKAGRHSRLLGRARGCFGILQAALARYETLGQKKRLAAGIGRSACTGGDRVIEKRPLRIFSTALISSLNSRKTVRRHSYITRWVVFTSAAAMINKRSCGRKKL